MKIACVGGGPASLYFSILTKLVDPSHDITIYERNPAGSTYGWGVTYWDELLHNLQAADPESAREISESSVRWDSWVVHVRDRATVRAEEGEEGFGIGRHKLLGILTERAASLGVRVEFSREIADEDELAGADLVVAGDGVNSVLRERHADHFGTDVAVGRNTYIWLGTTKVFDAFTFAFVETEHGWIWCYGYGFGKDHSTCVIECSPATWQGLGLHEASEADSLALLEKLFADILDGHPLIGRADADGSAHWLHFRTLTNRKWYRGSLVLMGDAAHTTHYSVGAGTALALGDAFSLVNALHGETRLESALARYERERKSAIRSAQKAARYSAQWYENLPRYVNLPPMQLFALLFQRRSRLLPHVPPRLYYRAGQAAGHVAGQLWSLRGLKRRLGSKAE
ncbi:FAD-dependent monooxygenase [Nonomuraea basaltis]|uniref:FAD-dependent monooxygenase n=1 Tax=Nonomuraea basaltis TaxID=2495887 RepID=UPI00110C48F6|nr:FAD-dependent monooxygenase [Nonomuraea basaltis]TMR97921.1 FAD-binding monooxygenase [Nonomuraea basaltis]